MFTAPKRVLVGTLQLRVPSFLARLEPPLRAAAVIAANASAACAEQPRRDTPSAGRSPDRISRAPPGSACPGPSHPGRKMMLGPALHTPGPATSDHRSQEMIVMRTMLATAWPHVTRHGATV